MFVEQIIEFELRGPGPLSRTCYAKLIIFMAKQKSPRKINPQVHYYLLLNILHKEPMYLLSFTWTKSITNFIKKMLRFKREL